MIPPMLAANPRLDRWVRFEPDGRARIAFGRMEYGQGIFTALAQISDLWVGLFKALIFGFLAGVIASYRVLNTKPGPKGVGEAVNQSVVVTFLLLFFVNFVITTLYLQLVPGKGA